ncbi:hypothetical protein JMG10_00220 [Nostoc ellipsosporum NOK]|jgi:hypothetical protein|nr:hypothetical protein [Nostoc ellipsosporum NOK]
MHNFTPEDLLLYLYKEVSPRQKENIEQALEKDWTLKEKMSVLQSARERLFKIQESPRTEVVLNILRYANNKVSSVTTH